MNFVVIVLALVLLGVVIVFGAASSAQSNAQAEQARAVAEMARAQLETAQAAQISAWGNVIAILALVTVLAIVLAVVVLVMYLSHRRTNGKKKPGELGGGPDPLQVLQMAMLSKLLQSMDPPALPADQHNLLDAPREDGGPLHWLK